MLSDPTEISVRFELDEQTRKQIQTTDQLLDTRFKLNNKDINHKTIQGQTKASKHKLLKDANERYRAPELYSIYDDNNTAANTITHAETHTSVKLNQKGKI